MALNKHMHSRNIYKNPPDFGKLAKIYPEFSSISKMDVTGKVSIDFKDPHSLRVLTKCLLKSDFNLDIVIPEDRLVPTLPLRLNYILWIEDLLASIKNNNSVQGLDIGTGACAIYPLLAVVKNKWHMVGTETDLESLQKAEENVKRNNLHNLIELIHNPTTSMIDFLFNNDNSRLLQFCMCNPPFYSNLQELCESRSTARHPPKNGFTGSPHELITEGGELEFCRKLINESKNHKNRVLIFTTMVGHKYTLQELLQDLKSDGVKHTHTEFCQGRVTRWGLAWTYSEHDISKLVPPRDKSRKKNLPIAFLVPELENSPYNLDSTFNKIKSMLENLSIKNKIIEKRGNSILLDIVAMTNTWANQRRKRRLIKNMEIQQTKRIKLNNKEKDLTIEDAANSLENNLDIKNTKVDIAHSSSENTCINTISATVDNNPIVHAFLKVFKKEKIFLEFEFLRGTGGKEALHQIIQFIKNNWK